MTIYSKQGQDLTFTAIRHARFGASCKTELIYCQTKSFSTIATLPTFTNLLHLPPSLFLTHHHHHHHHHCNTLLPAHSNIKRYGTIISQDILTNTYPSKYAFTKSNLICPPLPPTDSAKKWILETIYTTLSLDPSPSPTRAIHDKLLYPPLPTLSRHLHTVCNQA